MNNTGCQTKIVLAIVTMLATLTVVSERSSDASQGSQGIGIQGIGIQGIGIQGIGIQGIGIQGIGIQGIGIQGIGIQGIGIQGIGIQGIGIQGIDRVRSFLSVVSDRGLSFSSSQIAGVNVQGLQIGTGLTIINVSNPMNGVQLQAGPADSTAGSFISVPGEPDLKGTLWNIGLADTCAADKDCISPSTCANGVCSAAAAGILLYIADVEIDPNSNSSKYPSNGDIYLYTPYYRQPATEQWSSLCPFDALTGKPTAMAVPLNPFDHSDAGRSTFTFACTASGVASKCARNWGYKPWKTVTENVWNGTEFAPTQIPLAPFYDSCLIAARADYCQDDHSYTKNGTLVDLFDTLDGFTSINATSGLPYAPYQTGPMLHEEYQISALNVFPPPLPTPPPPLLCQSPTPGPHFVSENFSCSELQTMSTDDPGDLALVKGLRRSGMESSRYADLDPGRTCAASNYIDRCDPKEPYGCYRALNLNANAYGAFLAVNSPRHCSHDEDHDGEALDPLCNECVNRVCQIDPSCCGDPGPGFYPGSLVWDQRCTDIRQSVCKSDPASTTLWPPGVTAPPASSHVVSFLRGAIGAFEGFVTDTSGTTFAEGWACDPDHPDASIPVQISVGGPLGTGATLKTGTAFEVLAPSWKETVATECGGGARHGFRVAMPTVSTATDVYVYGIDIDVPGAPFSLLRG